VIEVNGLTKKYGDVAAIEGLTFNTEEGQILGFLGPNGAGKTTTMRILTCFLPPSSGTASVGGYDVVEESMEVRKRIGYLPEHPPVYNDMTVRSYLRFVGKIKGVPSAQLAGRVDVTMEMTGTAHMHNTVIGHLSKGYKQRVGLAQALVHDPAVLILDEPTVGLDPKQIIEIREVIKSLGGDHTVILSTHILPEVNLTCERVVIINNGRIVGEGTPESLTAQLKDGEVLRAQVTGPEEQIRSTISGVAGVLEVSVEQAQEVGDAAYIITTTPGEDVRDELSRRLVNGGFGLRELRSLEMTLEDIFLRLVTEEVNA
jgi:ABC-2 type transport system ATP-binding protein